MYRIKYIGKKDISTDTVAGTGTVWHGHGDVQTIVEEDAAAKLLRHSGTYVLDESSGQGEDSQVGLSVENTSIPLLGGTTELPEEVDLGNGRVAARADIIRLTCEGVSMEAEQWNALEPQEREELIREHIAEVSAALDQATRNATPKPPAVKKAVPAKKASKPKK